MSLSGQGQSTVREEADIAKSWHDGEQGGRAGAGTVIIEHFVDFDYEITLLTVRPSAICESWQPQPMSDKAHTEAEHIARSITDGLGGRGLLGVELYSSPELSAAV
ncbi:MAG TPA: ATP-grasp domain-containing protein [Candidatus Latescibacteria bacterium]|nr:ATP-grasp domain-containing protein [Candidatus Handelsmanbacteria bacterium]HIL08221.1 ATP-grasp domain-containing protein [Candidatus Latescibacterota bacterium]